MKIRTSKPMIRGMNMINRIILVVFYLLLAGAIMVCTPRGLRSQCIDCGDY